MNKAWANAEYSSSLINNSEEGWIALELVRRKDQQSQRVARIVFWDAEGQSYLELFISDVPLGIIEELISESKKKIATG